jgi:hypothetical protein
MKSTRAVEAIIQPVLAPLSAVSSATQSPGNHSRAINIMVNLLFLLPIMFPLALNLFTQIKPGPSSIRTSLIVGIGLQLSRCILSESAKITQILKTVYNHNAKKIQTKYLKLLI